MIISFLLWLIAYSIMSKNEGLEIKFLLSFYFLIFGFTELVMWGWAIFNILK